MEVWLSSKQEWEWSKKNLNPAVMRAAESLGDLLEPELKGVSDNAQPGVLRRVLDSRLKKAGFDQLNAKQRKKALETLCRCWTVGYAAPLARVLEERGELP